MAEIDSSEYTDQMDIPQISSSTASAPSSSMSNKSLMPNVLPPLDHYRIQLYNYAMVERLRCSQYSTGSVPLCPSYSAPYGSRLALQMSLFHNRVFQSEEPKPQHSYIGLIAMAILSSPEIKLVLSDIYQYILDNYPYFRARGPGWRNSIRHNLSLNDCFIKSGRSANGKGHYWAIHPANMEDFKKGDFRRRKAQRKVRKHMGLAVDDEGTDSPSPPPQPPMQAIESMGLTSPWNAIYSQSSTLISPSRKRQFDVASLLAPDPTDGAKRITYFTHQPPQYTYKLTNNESNPEDPDIDVEASDGDRPEQIPLEQFTVNLPPVWHGIMQQWPTVMDPRVFGRYYSQYIAAARRMHLSSSSSPTTSLPSHSESDQSSLPSLIHMNNS